MQSQDDPSVYSNLQVSLQNVFACASHSFYPLQKEETQAKVPHLLL